MCIGGAQAAEGDTLRLSTALLPNTRTDTHPSRCSAAAVSTSDRSRAPNTLPPAAVLLNLCRRLTSSRSDGVSGRTSTDIFCVAWWCVVVCGGGVKGWCVAECAVLLAAVGRGNEGVRPRGAVMCEGVITKKTV